MPQKPVWDGGKVSLVWVGWYWALTVTISSRYSSEPTQREADFVRPLAGRS